MQITLINPDTLTRPSGFSYGTLVKGGRILFLAGQNGIYGQPPGTPPGDVVEQFRRSIDHLKTVCEAAGATLQNIVKINIYVKDVKGYKAHLKPIGEVYRSYFGRHYPAMTLVEVTDFFDEGALLEIDGIAVL